MPDLQNGNKKAIWEKGDDVLDGTSGQVGELLEKGVAVTYGEEWGMPTTDTTSVKRNSEGGYRSS